MNLLFSVILIRSFGITRELTRNVDPDFNLRHFGLEIPFHKESLGNFNLYHKGLKATGFSRVEEKIPRPGPEMAVSWELVAFSPLEPRTLPMLLDFLLYFAANSFANHVGRLGDGLSDLREDLLMSN